MILLFSFSNPPFYVFLLAKKRFFFSLFFSLIHLSSFFLSSLLFFLFSSSFLFCEDILFPFSPCTNASARMTILAIRAGEGEGEGRKKENLFSLSDSIVKIDSFCMLTLFSLVTSVKDYFEVLHKLSAYENTFFFSYSDLGPILISFVFSVKDFFLSFLSLSWFKSPRWFFS